MSPVARRRNSSARQSRFKFEVPINGALGGLVASGDPRLSDQVEYVLLWSGEN